MAILLEAEASDGGRLQGITAGMGAEGLILTYGDLGEGRVRILLDGVCRGDPGEPLLWLWLDSPLRQGGDITVTGEGGGEVYVYVLRDGGEVEEIPLSVERDGGEEDDPETNVDTHEDVYETEITEGTEATEVTEETEVTESTETAEGVAPPDTEDPSSTDTQSPSTAIFLGCRETGAEEGMYTVQFLFGGEGIGTPVLCMEGGGLLYATCGTMKGLSGERGWEVRRYCTVQGLSVDRRYVFWIGTEEGWVTVTYEGGVFCGFG
ncbi:MAG: hypothetical protein IKM33_06225 [Clostridia bacterium]|nr:hypothetical protein [Clostridia bacterium]